MTHEEMAQLNEAVAKSFPHDGDIRIAIEAGAAALRREQCKPIEVVASYEPQPTQEPQGDAV